MQNWKKIFSSEVITLESAEATRALGMRVAEALEPGDVIGLVGDLGAGKTQFCQGVLQGLGARDEGGSPTFSLVHEHRDTSPQVAHFDFYRLNSPAEAQGIGWEEFIDSGMVLLVEWANMFDGSLMPESTHWIILEHAAEGKRRARGVAPE